MGNNNEKEIGIVLSGANSKEASCQLLEAAEKGLVTEGKLLLIKSSGRYILARAAQIIPYNAFYTEGDPWSEPRRKGLAIPEDVARRYEICKLDLLIELGIKGRRASKEITYPPRPGDIVIELDPKENEENIFGIERGSQKHIWYGSLVGYKDAPIPLYVENIPMHLAIFGVTGSGKSFDTGALIEKLVDIPVSAKGNASYPMIIIDAHGDYLDYVDHFNKGEQLGKAKSIKRFVFPEAYIRLRGKFENTQPISINLDALPTRDLAEIIILYYKGTLEGSDLAVDAIDTIFEAMRQAGYDSINRIFADHFDDLLSTLQGFDNNVISSATKAAAERALRSFRVIQTEHKLLTTKSELSAIKKNGEDIVVNFIDGITKDQSIAIFDFSADGAPGIDIRTKQLVMTYLASLLFVQFTNYKLKKDDRYLMFVIEEAQNFCPDKNYPIGSSLAHSKLSAIATQGRKFGLTLCLISQRPSFVDRIILSMCNTFFIHRMSPEDVSYVKGVSGGLPTSLIPKLTTLDTGDLIVTGQMTTVPFPLLIHIHEDDRKIKPTVGKTNVSATLAKSRGLE